LHEQIELPTREQVREICSYLEPKVLNQVFLADDLIDVVGHFIARKFRVSVLHAKALQVEFTELNINANYDPDRDELGKPSIELIIVTNPSDHQFILDKPLWDLFVNRLADSLAHEMIHMHQSRTRDFITVDYKVPYTAHLDENLVYLSDPDEVDAYAYNIATELREHPNPLEIFYNPAAVSVNDSVNLWAYMQAFSKDIKHPTIKQLLKKVYKHLTC
jgi:hypothetical protein